MSVSGKSDRIIRSSLHFPSNLRRLGHDSVTLHESREHNFELSFLSHNHGLSCWRKKVQLGRPRPRARSHAWERRCVVGRCARASEPAPAYLSWGLVWVWLRTDHAQPTSSIYLWILRSSFTQVSPTLALDFICVFTKVYIKDTGWSDRSKKPSSISSESGPICCNFQYGRQPQKLSRWLGNIPATPRAAQYIAPLLVAWRRCRTCNSGVSKLFDQ